MLYGDWIGRWASSFPDKEAVFDVIGNRRYSYGEFAREIRKMAHFLIAGLELKPGDRVSVLSQNRIEYLVLFFAASRIGAILVPLNCRLAPGEFDYFIQDAAPSVLFFDKSYQETVHGLKSRVTIRHYVCLDRDGPERWCLPELWAQLSDDPLPEMEIHKDDPQLIIYTSGTTGLPKGVIQTHEMITWNSVNTHIGWDLRSDDRTILHSALFYTAGWNIFTLPLFHCRGTNILTRGFDPDLVLNLMERERVTVFFGVPTMYQMLLEAPGFDRADLSSIRFMVSGGAPLPRKVFEAYQEKKQIHLCQGYGLTEVGPNNFLANGKLGSVGHPMVHVDVKVVDSAGHPMDVDVDGELWLRGPHVCAGYWNKPEETAKAMESGWFHTGDLARIDADGHLWIVGRKKDMFISGGINIYPAEIERVIETHPFVSEACVIGVADERWGEVGKAVVALKPQKSMNLDELQAFLKDRMGKFKIPKYLAVVKRLPRTAASGKVQKFKVTEKHGGADKY